MNWKLATLGLMLISVALALVTYISAPQIARDNDVRDGASHDRLIEEKAKARKAEGAPELPENTDAKRAKSPQPVCAFTGRIVTSKEEMLRDWEKGWKSDQDYLKQLARNYPTAAAHKRQRLLHERERILAMPDGIVTQSIPSISVGKPVDCP